MPDVRNAGAMSSIGSSPGSSEGPPPEGNLAPFEPVDVQIKRDTGITVTFADGLVAEFNLVEVRLACPCATCRGLRDQGAEVWPRPGSPIPLRIDDASFHGAWGLNITWNDKHATGIFPFEALYKWAKGEIGFRSDSGLGEMPSPEQVKAEAEAIRERLAD